MTYKTASAHDLRELAKKMLDPYMQEIRTQHVWLKNHANRNEDRMRSLDGKVNTFEARLEDTEKRIMKQIDALVRRVTELEK